MTTVDYQEVVRDSVRRGAFLRDDFEGFREDYLVLHCLIREHRPRTFLEIGTSTGLGTQVICRAMGVRRWFGDRHRVFSIDVPPGTDPSIRYPEGEDGHPDRAGRLCTYRYTQLYGDSLTYDFSRHYPLEGWFIDGKHDYTHARGDTESALLAQPRLILWHDMQVPGVERAVREVMASQAGYHLVRVAQTRMAYAVRC